MLVFSKHPSTRRLCQRPEAGPQLLQLEAGDLLETLSVDSAIKNITLYIYIHIFIYLYIYMIYDIYQMLLHADTYHII